MDTWNMNHYGQRVKEKGTNWLVPAYSDLCLRLDVLFFIQLMDECENHPGYLRDLLFKKAPRGDENIAELNCAVITDYINRKNWRKGSLGYLWSVFSQLKGN